MIFKHGLVEYLPTSYRTKCNKQHKTKRNVTFISLLLCCIDFSIESINDLSIKCIEWNCWFGFPFTTSPSFGVGRYYDFFFVYLNNWSALSTLGNSCTPLQLSFSHIIAPFNSCEFVRIEQRIFIFHLQCFFRIFLNFF